MSDILDSVIIHPVHQQSAGCSSLSLLPVDTATVDVTSTPPRQEQIDTGTTHA